MNVARNLRTAVLLTATTTVLLGVAYPLVITGAAQLLFPANANGQLIVRKGVVVGSRLIGQPFSRPEYFHSRPSATATPYDAANSGGSNYGPTNRKLIDAVKANVEAAKKENPSAPVPIDLVTTSALLDLVSDNWLERLVTEIAARNLPFYAALTYDGRIEFDPADDADTAIVASVNKHQVGDKGFGPALGPSAANAAIVRFEALGYTVKQDRADWMFGPVDRPIQNEVLSGWAFAAREMNDPSLAAIEDWLTRRRAAVAAGHSSIRVGHVDFFACPTGTR